MEEKKRGEKGYQSRREKRIERKWSARREHNEKIVAAKYGNGVSEENM